MKIAYGRKKIDHSIFMLAFVFHLHSHTCKFPTKVTTILTYALS